MTEHMCQQITVCLRTVLSPWNGAVRKKMLNTLQERGDPKDDHVHDTGQGRLGTLPRRVEEHRNRRPGSKEIGISVPDVGVGGS